MLSKRLTEQEIDAVLKKIEKKYHEYAKKYGEEFFSYKGFKKRYFDYLKTRGNIEIFLFAEIQALEDRKKEIEAEKEKQSRIAEAKAVLERKEEEILAKIANYPEENFHPDARLEIRKLFAVFGVISQQLEKYYYDVDKKNQPAYQKALNILKEFKIKPFTGNFGNYYRELFQIPRNPSKIEGLEQNVLKDWGSALATFIFYLEKTNQEKKDPELTEFLSILKKITEDFRLQFFKPLQP